MSCYILRDGERIDYLKGAPDIIVGMCQLSNLEKNRLLKQVDQWAGEGLRLLGLAYRAHRSLDDHTGYIWAGLVAMEDPIRLGVVEAIQLAQRAGIKVKMITGDYSKTAEHIGRVLGLLGAHDLIVEGDALATMDDAELRHTAKHTAIFSRIRPNDKFRIVKGLQSNGEVTAMIGDGVNTGKGRRATCGCTW